MDWTEARDLVRRLIGDALNPDLIDDCVEWAVMPDAEGRYPIDAGWEPTYDGWWAAASAAEMVAASQPDQLTQVTSEGTTLRVTPRDWASTARTWRTRSVIARSSSDLGLIEITPATPDYRPTTEIVQP